MPPKDFQRGWEAAIEAACKWHQAQAKQTLILAGRSRFPKSLERDAELHKSCAERLATLSPDDV